MVGSGSRWWLVLYVVGAVASLALIVYGFLAAA